MVTQYWTDGTLYRTFHFNAVIVITRHGLRTIDHCFVVCFPLRRRRTLVRQYSTTPHPFESLGIIMICSSFQHHPKREIIVVLSLWNMEEKESKEKKKRPFEFYSNLGFGICGRANWRERKNGWTLETTAITRAGPKTTTTNLKRRQASHLSVSVLLRHCLCTPNLHCHQLTYVRKSFFFLQCIRGNHAPTNGNYRAVLRTSGIQRFFLRLQ